MEVIFGSRVSRRWVLERGVCRVGKGLVLWFREDVSVRRGEGGCRGVNGVVVVGLYRIV